MTELQRREDVAAVARDATLLQTHAAALFTAPGDWVGGNPDGDVTVVEFMDYRCGYCQKAHSEVAELVKADGNIRLILKELPVLGEASVIAARFAIATRLIHGEAAYKATHDALMTLRGDPTAETLTRLATQLGHPPAPILDKMAAPEVTAVIEANHALAMAMQINGTPAFVIDSTMLRGYLPLADLQRIVAEERAG
jgi:protein-disulfide isomerase